MERIDISVRSDITVKTGQDIITDAGQTLVRTVVEPVIL